MKTDGIVRFLFKKIFFYTKVSKLTFTGWLIDCLGGIFVLKLNVEFQNACST